MRIESCSQPWLWGMKLLRMAFRLYTPGKQDVKESVDTWEQLKSPRKERRMEILDRYHIEPATPACGAARTQPCAWGGDFMLFHLYSHCSHPPLTCAHHSLLPLIMTKWQGWFCSAPHIQTMAFFFFYRNWLHLAHLLDLKRARILLKALRYGVSEPH